MAPVNIEIELTATNNQDGVRAGMTALPNAAAAASGGLLTSGTGSHQISTSSGAMLVQSGTSAGQISLTSGQVLVQSGTGSGQISTSSGLVNINQTFPSNFSSFSIDASGRVDVAKFKGTASAGAAGYVGIDWGNVNAPTTTLNLSGTTIATSQAVASVSGAVGSVTGAVGSIATGGIAAASFAAGAIDAAAIATDAIGANEFAQAAADKVWSTAARVLTAGTNIALAKGVGVTGFNDITAASVWGVLRSGNQTADTFGEYVDAAVSSRLASGNVTVGGYAAGQDPATLVLDADTDDHDTVDTVGAAIIDAGSAGDPWATSLPGAYGAGTAGRIVGDNLNATVSSRSTYAGTDTSGTTTLLTQIGVAGAGLTAIGDTRMANLNATVSSRLADADYDAAPSLDDIAARILIDPAQPIATDADGFVTLASAGLDEIAIESGVNARQAIAVIGAACVGVASGLDTTSVIFKGANVATTRIAATVDGDGNRSSVTLTLPT